MNIPLISADLFGLRARSHAQSNIWSAIVIDIPVIDSFIEEFKNGIASITDYTLDAYLVDSELGFLQNYQGSVADYSLFWGFDAWEAPDWRKFDAERSKLDRSAVGGALLLSERAVYKLYTSAPNITSWLGARVYKLEQDTEYLTEGEREERLQSFRVEYGFSDAEVIEMANAKSLPSEPHFGEWLILLGREDLLDE